MKNKLLVYLLCVALLLTVVVASGCTEVDVEAITITSADNTTEIETGKTLQLSATITPPQASQEVTWSSSDTSKATVDANGLVTAIAAGNVTITATSVANDKISKTFALIINAAAPIVDTTPTTVVLTTANNVTSVKIGETLKVTATVNPAAASQEVIWSTSDSAIATVNNGVVTGVAEGPVTITATSKTVSTVKNSIKITVTNEEVKDPSADYASMEFSTHEQYIAAENAALLKVKGVVTYMTPEKDGTVNYYLQNGTDGFYVYQQNVTDFPIELGKSYAVGGAKAVYNGQQELKTIEYCVELKDACTFTAVDLTGKDVSSLDEMNLYQGAVVTGTASVKTAPTAGTKAYNISVTIGEKAINLRIDPANMTSEEFTAIGNKVATMVAGTEIEFTGVMSAFGYGKATPQIHIYKASEMVLSEASAADKVKMVKDAIVVTSFVKSDVDTIDLISGINVIPDVEITWASDNTNIITSLGAVTHPENDTVVTLTATITHKTDASATDTKEFKVNVAGTTFNAEKLAELNFDDAAEANNNGQSATKSGYTNKAAENQTLDEANTVELGGKKWILTGTLISSSKGGDHCDGTFAGRMSEKQGKVETTAADEYNYVEFDLATYNSQTHGTCVTVMYKMENSEDWVESGMTISVNSYKLTTYRVALEAGVKNIRICVVSGSGKVNIDNIILYK